MKRDLRCLPKLKTLFPFSLHSVSLEWASLVSCKVPGVEFSSTTLLSRRGFVQRAAAGPSRQPGPSASSASCGLVTLSPFLHLCISGFSSLRGDFPGRMGGGEGGRGLSGVTRVKPREGNLPPKRHDVRFLRLSHLPGGRGGSRMAGAGGLPGPSTRLPPATSLELPQGVRLGTPAHLWGRDVLSSPSPVFRGWESARFLQGPRVKARRGGILPAQPPHRLGSGRGPFRHWAFTSSLQTESTSCWASALEC